MISLYFHIPFCTKKCPYCHFYVIPNQARFRDLLYQSLLLEWDKQLPLLAGNTITSIYFGGGTPTLFEHIEPILKKIDYPPDCEITIEANPEECTLERFTYLRSIGINRLSLGIQSLDDRSLQTLERTHSAKKGREAIELAHKGGFQNISIDLIYDLPGQTLASWQYTLDQLSDLAPQHLSLYNLTIEPHTPFHKRKVQTPAPSLSLQFLTAAVEQLEQIGLKRYEISAFAKPGYESRHNLGYWTGRPFLGFGPSAFSYWEGERFRNIANLHRYARALQENRSPVDFRERLPYPASAKELLTIRLRLKEGAPISLVPDESKQTIDSLIEQGLLQMSPTHLQLTQRGLLVYDTVAAEII